MLLGMDELTGPRLA